MSNKIKVGINGFGRIARVILRSLEMRDTDIEICGVNLHNADFKRMAYQVEYDSVFGRFMGDVEATDDGISITDATGAEMSGVMDGDQLIVDFGEDFIVTMEKAE